MSTPSARLLVSVGEQTALIKIAGRANFECSVNLKTLLEELRRKNFDRYLFDLTDCLHMDSTFVGVLAGFGLKLNPVDAAKTGALIEFLNPNSRISELLENLGVVQLFTLVHGDPLPVENLASVPQAAANPSRLEVSSTCLDAHKTLMDLSPGNVAKFKDVAQFLAEDVKKLKAR